MNRASGRRGSRSNWLGLGLELGSGLGSGLGLGLGLGVGFGLGFEGIDPPARAARGVRVKCLGIAARGPHRREVHELHAAILARPVSLVEVALLIAQSQHRAAKPTKVLPQRLGFELRLGSGLGLGLGSGLGLGLDPNPNPNHGSRATGSCVCSNGCETRGWR